MDRSIFKQNVSQLVTNKITAAEAASWSVPPVSQSVVIDSVVKFLEKSYLGINREISNCLGSRSTIIHFEDCDFFSKKEVMRFLEEDGYKVETSGSIHITISW